MAKQKDHRVNLTTNPGRLSFPKFFPDNHGKKDDGTPSYETQLLIDKSDVDGVAALNAAVAEVAEAKWGKGWKKMGVTSPLRDGDKEKNELTRDGEKKKDKYPERLGHFFLNARSNRPVGVVDAKNEVITESGLVYGGSYARLNVNLYPYNNKGNLGVGVALEAVQKVSEGEPFGESMKDPTSVFVEYAGGDLGKKAKKGKKGKAEAEPEAEPTKKGKKKKG